MPKVKAAASKCGIYFLYLPELLNSASKQPASCNEVAAADEQNDPLFIGGPRQTMTKLMEKGIEAMFSPHPCPAWTLDWSSLPAAVSPEGSPRRAKTSTFMWKQDPFEAKQKEQCQRYSFSVLNMTLDFMTCMTPYGSSENDVHEVTTFRLSK